MSGSIAAYKSAFLTRLLIKSGAEVQVIMTASAFGFITSLTLSTLSKRPVFSKFVKDDTGEWNNHVDLGLWADLFLIAPMSADTLSKLANGICDNLLSATYLSARCPVMLAPAMDLDMYKHPAVQANLQRLGMFGNRVLEAETGELASGLSGQGRMMEPERILEQICNFFLRTQDFYDKKVLITMGPTQESLDPVRFISNHSSGKMGLALAESFRARGARVFVVSGPIYLPVTKENYHWQDVQSADEMYSAADSIHGDMDIVIFAAAVADYAPAKIAKQKIKKSEEKVFIELIKNVDIAYALGQKKEAHQVHVGFALETENEKENAIFKLKKKNFDLIVLNSTQVEGAGFQLETNNVEIFSANEKSKKSGLAHKNEIAHFILDHIKVLLQSEEF